eukprot:6978866-Lingulodinium_polyedra.AAC.1
MSTSPTALHQHCNEHITNSTASATRAQHQQQHSTSAAMSTSPTALHQQPQHSTSNSTAP